MANNNKPMVDLPFFELCNQSPAITNAVSAMTTVETGDDRFIYTMLGALFYRYDTVGDTWQQLATPNIPASTAASLRYTRNRGYHGSVISATANTVTIPGLRGESLDGSTLAILSGTGSGQERTLSYISEYVHDAGVVTSVTTLALGDTTKKWQINQWAGYVVGITFGTDATQYKKILYNDTSVLYISDANLQPHDPWNNQPFAAIAPYVLPAITAGVQSHYQIMSSTFSVDPWTVIPDYSSYFTTRTGGIYMISTFATTPFFQTQYYDVAADTWQTKTSPQNLLSVATWTDLAVERTAKIGNRLASNVGVVSATSRTLNDAGQEMVVGQYNNCRLVITSGTGIGQNRRVVNNTNKTFTIPRSWDIMPDATSTYEIWPDFDRIYLLGGNSSAMYAYSPENDYWLQGQHFDDGITANITVTMKGWVPISVATGNRIAAGITSINSVPTAGGINYVIGDVLTCAVGGTGAQFTVTSINPGGSVSGLILTHSGLTTGYTTGVGKATTGGTGTGCTIEIISVGSTATITTSTANWFVSGNVISFAGCTESAWNNQHTIIGVSGTTVFSVATTAIANMSSLATQSTVLVVDGSKNWIVNEHVGRLVHIMIAGVNPTSQIRWIISNTATTLTVNTIVAGVNGTSKYVIYDSKVFGIDDQQKMDDRVGYGQATGGTTTTLIDTTKKWVPNMYVGYLFKVEAGSGYGSGRIAITSNTSNTLTFGTQTFVPDSTTKYEIADAWGLITTGGTTAPISEPTTKNWVVNQWAGKRFRITGGTSLGQETTVTSNTTNTIVSSALAATDATSTYAILSIPPRGLGTSLLWTWGASTPNKQRDMYSPRGGGSNSFDIYDITKGKWTFGTFFSPQSELFNTGSSYTYDGLDTIYMSRSIALNPIRIFAYNIKTNKSVGAMTTTMTQNTVHIGNFMETVTSPSGYSFLYCLQNSGTQLCRSLIF